MKAIITDLDRTLLHTDKSVSEYTVDILKKCHEKGILIMVATASPLRDVWIYNDLIGFDAITATNGAVVSLSQNITEFGISCESGETILSKILIFPDVFLSIETSKGLYSNRDIPMLSYYNTSPSDAVYFGDDNDDIEPIMNCGPGIAVSNAIPSVLEVAAQLTDSNDSDGVAKFIEKHIFNGV